MKKWKNIIYPIGVGLIVLFLLHFVFFIGYVPTASMEPTIMKGSLLMGIRLFDDLTVGDVVVFEWEDQLLVKRIYATEGMIVEHNGMKERVPDESFYMVGDNQEGSYDSKCWEAPFVNRDRIISKVGSSN